MKNICSRSRRSYMRLGLISVNIIAWKCVLLCLIIILRSAYSHAGVVNVSVFYFWVKGTARSQFSVAFEYFPVFLTRLAQQLGQKSSDPPPPLSPHTHTRSKEAQLPTIVGFFKPGVSFKHLTRSRPGVWATFPRPGADDRPPENSKTKKASDKR